VVVNYHHHREQAERLVQELQQGAANGTSDVRAIAVQADVSHPDGVQQLLAQATRAFGGVTVLVNAASPRIAAKSLDALRWDDVQQQLEVQVKSAFLMTQACQPAMVAAGWGRVINIGSQACEGVPVPGWTAYALAKGGLVTLTHYLAAELGPVGITVNCVSPGMTDTSFISGVSAKQQLMAARQIPLRRLGEPTDVAAAVAFLASPDAAYITGQTLRVNGGGSMS
jgi:3-oxoacyl-[acyl-carrier protein] reductase